MLKARDNPFATARLERLLEFDPELLGSSWEEIDGRREALGRESCVLGHHGAGKTTFLAALSERLRSKGRVISLFFNDGHSRLDSSDRCLIAGADGAYVMIDGDAHLPIRERWQLRRGLEQAKGVLWARHRRGRMPVLIHLKSSEQLAKRLLARVAPELQTAIEPHLPVLLDEAGGNLRELWMICYDQLASGKLKI